MMRRLLIAIALALMSTAVQGQHPIAVAVSTDLDTTIRRIAADSAVAFCIDVAEWDALPDATPRVSVIRHRESVGVPIMPTCGSHMYLAVRPMCWLRADEVMTYTDGGTDLLILLCGPRTDTAPREVLKVFYRRSGGDRIS